VAQRFQRGDKVATSKRFQPLRSVYLLLAGITLGTVAISLLHLHFRKQNLFQPDRVAELFVEVLQHYLMQKRFLLHEFVLMPD
jgi:hypothetical protein